MRITGGIYRGRRIACPPGIIRPAMEKMRESLFSILGPLSGISFLDLFSGSGCVGIEAASRGATPVHLVENDRPKRKVILSNIEMVESEITLFMTDVFRFLRTAKEQYEIIYADPPFPLENKLSILATVAKYQVLRDGGLFILHGPKEEDALWPEHFETFEAIDKRFYGRSVLYFYRQGANNVP